MRVCRLILMLARFVWHAPDGDIDIFFPDGVTPQLYLNPLSSPGCHGFVNVRALTAGVEATYEGYVVKVMDGSGINLLGSWVMSSYKSYTAFVAVPSTVTALNISIMYHLSQPRGYVDLTTTSLGTSQLYTINDAKTPACSTCWRRALDCTSALEGHVCVRVRVRVR